MMQFYAPAQTADQAPRQEANAPDHGAGKTCPECNVDLTGQSPRKHAARHWDDPSSILWAESPPDAYARIRALYDMEPEHHPVPPSRIDQRRY